MRLHHVGFVVADIKAAMPGFIRSMAATWDSQIFTDPNQRVKVAFLTTRPGDAQVELVEPDGGLSRATLSERKGWRSASRLLRGSRSGAGAERLRSRGSLIVKRPKPAVAFQGRRIAWVLTPEKFLIELLEEGSRCSAQRSFLSLS